MSDLYAILPMRSGSQRVKNKNLRLITGKPLYRYILETLLDCPAISGLVINTDIEEIIDQYEGADKITIIKRESALAGNCNMNMVIESTLNQIPGDYFLQTHATNPLLSAETIGKAIDCFLGNLPSYDSLFSVTRIQKRFWTEAGRPFNHDPRAEPTTQDLEPLMEENSCIYLFSRESFTKEKNRIGSSPYLFETPALESIDIDTEEELKLIEAILRRQ